MGDEVEVWSNSHKRWAQGSIQSVEDGKVSVKYASPDGQPMVKQMPEGHEHLRHAQTASTGNAGASKKQVSSSGVYKVGDQIEIWSQSNNAWCRGSIEKLQGELVNVKYQSPDGPTMTKLMPNGHEYLRHLEQQGVPPPPPPPGRSMEYGNDMPPPLSESAGRPDSMEGLAVYQDACNDISPASSIINGGSAMNSHAPTSSKQTKGYRAAVPGRQSSKGQPANTAQVPVRDSNEVFVAESTSWVPGGSMMCGMPIKANKKTEVPLNDDGTPVARCPDTDRCCRCSMPIGSYFDHTCPRCEGVVCLNCLDDVKFIIASYRCPSCGDQRYNEPALKQTLWYMQMYRNAQRTVTAVPLLLGGLFGLGPEAHKGPARSNSKQAVEEPPQYEQQAPPAAAPKAKAAAGPPPAPPKPKQNVKAAAPNPNASAVQDGSVPEYHTRPPAGWAEGAAGWIAGPTAGGAAPDPTTVAAAMHQAATAQEKNRAAQQKPTGHAQGGQAPQQAQQAPRANGDEQARQQPRQSQQGLQAPNLFSSLGNQQQQMPQRGANPLASANASQNAFQTRIPPDQMSPMR
jgi:hypothetical protein